MEGIIYDQKGKKSGSIKLSKSVFELPWNADLVHQVVKAIEGNKRVAIAHTKDRSEVSGTGKKPWRQKGTGRARHGSRRSPIWRTGGVAHGPRNDTNFERKVNRKMKVKALYTLLSKKFKDGEILFVNDLEFNSPKTKDARETLISLSKIKGFEMLLNKRKNSLYIATDKIDTNLLKSFNNFGNVLVEESRNMNPLDILKYKYLLIENPEVSLKVIEKK